MLAFNKSRNQGSGVSIGNRGDATQRLQQLQYLNFQIAVYSERCAVRGIYSNNGFVTIPFNQK